MLKILVSRASVLFFLLGSSAALTAALTSALAQEQLVDLSGLTCKEAADRIKAAEEKPTLVQTGPDTYTDVYRGRSFCPFGTMPFPQDIKTSDNERCHIGFNCQP